MHVPKRTVNMTVVRKFVGGKLGIKEKTGENMIVQIEETKT